MEYFNVNKFLDWLNSYPNITKTDSLILYRDIIAYLTNKHNYAEEKPVEMKIEPVEFIDLCGTAYLTGVERGFGDFTSFGTSISAMYLKFTLDGVTYRMFEDPDDGWRSYASALEIINEPCKVRLPKTKVRIAMSDDKDEEVLEIREWNTNDILIRIGTNYYEDYYPVCIMEWNPLALPENKKK